MLRGKARKTGAFPERANGNGVMVMSQRKGGKRCLYRHTNSPGLTPTHRRSVGRQGALSPRLAVMPWRGERSCCLQQSQQARRQEEVEHACMD